MSDTYYDQDGITIYHADNADVEWPAPADVGLLLTDPPYGINHDTDYSTLNGSTRQWAAIDGDQEPFDPVLLLVYSKVILFGANHYAHQLPPSSGWLVWDKRAGKQAPNFMSDAELAWCSFPSPIRVFRHLWGVNRDSEKGLSPLHPTQKPVALMRWIIDQWTKPGDLIFDPYMGSGPIARACLDLGRRYIGIEIVEEYCEAAVNRLGQLALALDDV